MNFVEVTDSSGRIVEMEWLRRAEPVHRQLRDRLPDDYVARLTAIFAAGARMTLAVEWREVRGLALWRIIENTYEGRRFYIDDLVSDAPRRSQGVGSALVAALEATATALDCDVLALDSGTQRSRAHAFYFHAGFSIPSFSFRKALK